VKAARHLALVLVLACAGSSAVWAADTAPVLREGQATEAALLDALDPPPLVRQWKPGQRPPAATPAKASLLITFVTGSAVLTAPAKATLDQLAGAMLNERLAKAQFTIEGHADPRGSVEGNRQLSLARAQSVAQYLVQARGLDAARLKPEGKGSSELLKPSEPAAPENRRVTIVARPG
jgi:outer membrane protein OmpA-like peptidoglycan-associated protein